MPERPRHHNATIEQIVTRMRSAQRVLVLTHTKPDGDAAGSALAAVRTLNTLRPGTARAWFFGPLPLWIRDVIGDSPADLFEPPFSALTPGSEPDAILITDTCSFSQLEPVKELLSTRAHKTAVVDHHVSGDANVADMRFTDPSLAAACQPVAALCTELLGVQSASQLPRSVAEVLYLGLATDTGWFRHSNTSSAVMRLAADLLDAGADGVGLYQNVEQRSTVGRLRLIARALASVDLRLDDRLAFVSLDLDGVRRSGASPGETGGLTDFTQSLTSVLVTALLTEVPPEQRTGGGSGPMVKISMRSKDRPIAVDVNAIAKEFGGGGHVHAAGARAAMSIDEAKRAIEEAVARSLPRS
ncbi:MAG TPA: DHH family phosphoesterase [Phycisphaerales bacterium]|nr:DHH family phosphoesterase [Phycisphaerales bacterium]